MQRMGGLCRDGHIYQLKKRFENAEQNIYCISLAHYYSVVHATNETEPEGKENYIEILQQ